MFGVVCSKKLGWVGSIFFNFLLIFFSIKIAYGTLSKIQSNLNTLKSLTKKLKPPQSCLMAQKLQISDVLVHKYKKLLYLKKQKILKSSSIFFCRFSRKNVWVLYFAALTSRPSLFYAKLTFNFLKSTFLLAVCASIGSIF